MASIQVVARRARISTATVPHVLNDPRIVLPATRKRVLMAIGEHRYQPGAVGRGLATDTNHTVGVVGADITNQFFAQLVRGREDRLAPLGHGLCVCDTDERPEREARHLDRFLRKRLPAPPQRNKL